MTKIDLTITGRVESLHLESGDRVVVTLEPSQILERDQSEGLIDHLKEWFAPHEVVLLNGLHLVKERARRNRCG